MQVVQVVQVVQVTQVVQVVQVTQVVQVVQVMQGEEGGVRGCYAANLDIAVMVVAQQSPECPPSHILQTIQKNISLKQVGGVS